MKNFLAMFMLLGLLTACSSTSINIFSKKTPHEKYAEKLDDTNLEDTPEGREWLAVSKSALENAHTIKLPYTQQGYFSPGKPRAMGLKFTTRRGEKLIFSLDKKAPLTIFADLFKQQGSQIILAFASDTAASQFSIDIDEPGTYVLRLQPELFQSGAYSLSVSIGPSLEFPVAQNKGRVASVWGDSRDGGKRHHEGIDIFAPKKTPVVAAADGVVTAVKHEGIGGKTVWVRTEKNITLYYAHLDKQLVAAGQTVKQGEVLGLVGNTGNARYTPSHLHFGIYTSSGPIDPLPFVDKQIKKGKELADKNLKNNLRLLKAIKINKNGPAVSANTLLVPLAANAMGYLTETPNGRLIAVPFTYVQEVKAPVKKAGGSQGSSAAKA